MPTVVDPRCDLTPVRKIDPDQVGINGQGGDIGIDVSAVGFLRIDRCRISSMGAQGVVITSGSVVITNAYINDNGHDGVSADGVVDVVVQNTVSAHNLSGAAPIA